MKETIYIFTSGKLKRKDNSLAYVTDKGDKKYIPVENVKEILVFGETDINKKLIEFLSQKEIILSYFNYHGYYMGSFYPREHYNSGFMILNQAGYYLDAAKRIQIARKFVKGAADNFVKNLAYYNRRGDDLREQINAIENHIAEIENISDVENLMGLEGNIKKEYYEGFNIVIKNSDFRIFKRTKRPPGDYLNALISFANQLVYNFVLSEIYHTHLDPRIGYLHSTNHRRFSLNLDVAEIFKPVIGDRVIFSVLNKKMIQSEDFSPEMKGIYLKDKGKRVFLEEFQEKLGSTIQHKRLKRNVSYRSLIRMELYKLEKHLMNEQEYAPFAMNW